jgi:hypothetical protein
MVEDRLLRIGDAGFFLFAFFLKHWTDTSMESSEAEKTATRFEPSGGSWFAILILVGAACGLTGVCFTMSSACMHCSAKNIPAIAGE